MNLQALADSVPPVMATHRWQSNAELIADVARLGYLNADDTTLDPTYGLGVFWKQWQPRRLIAGDLDPDKSPIGGPLDFTDLSRFHDGMFDAVVLDPPYQLNGTGGAERYGVHLNASWQERYRLIEAGIVECLRVTRLGGHLLLKCQDQVCGGQVRWQTLDFANHATAHGARLVDRFDLLSYRPQPAGRRQVHARRNSSTLLIFEKG